MQIEHELGVALKVNKPYDCSVKWLKTKKMAKRTPRGAATAFQQ